MVLNNVTGEEQDLAAMVAYALRGVWSQSFGQPDPEVVGVIIAAVTPCVICCLELEEPLNRIGEDAGRVIGALVELVMRDGPWPGDVPTL